MGGKIGDTDEPGYGYHEYEEDSPNQVVRERITTKCVLPHPPLLIILFPGNGNDTIVAEISSIMRRIVSFSKKGRVIQGEPLRVK